MLSSYLTNGQAKTNDTGSMSLVHRDTTELNAMHKHTFYMIETISSTIERFFVNKSF